MPKTSSFLVQSRAARGCHGDAESRRLSAEVAGLEQGGLEASAHRIAVHVFGVEAVLLEHDRALTQPGSEGGVSGYVARAVLFVLDSRTVCDLPIRRTFSSVSFQISRALSRPKRSIASE